MSKATPVSPSPVASVVMPFYNPGEYLRPAIQSVFAQSFTDWELLLIDDGSTDGSVEWVNQLQDDRVRVVADGQNRRLANRLNQGAQLARGEFVFRVDADDIMHPNRLEAQLQILRQSSPDTVLGSSAYSIDEASRVVGLRPALTGQHVGYAARHSFIHPTVASSREWFLRNPYSTEHAYRRSEDAELWCRTAAFTDFKWIEEPLYFYREVGVFKLSNYLGTADGLLHLIKTHQKTPWSRFESSAKEWGKMSIAWGLDKIGASDMLVRQRSQKLSDKDVATANDIVKRIMKTPLPLNQPNHTEISLGGTNA